MTETTKKTKKKGPIRTGAVVPFIIIVAIIVLYFKFFFDSNLRKALEYGGYQALGAEVDIAKLETSFFNASIRIQGIEVTDSQKPTHNSISIGDIRFGVLWDALLRAKVVINEIAVEQVEFGKPRKTAGKVKPPEPVEVTPAEEDKPSKIKQEAEKLKNQAVETAQKNYNNNVLGDAANMLGGSSANVQLDKIQGTLPSKEMAAKLETDLKAKQEAWQTRIKNLPQGKDFQALGDRLNKVKTKDFKSLDEFQNSLKEADAIFKEADAKYKEVQSANKDLNADLANTQNQIKALDDQIKADVKNLEARFNIPHLDPKSISQALFRQYLDPYLAKFNHYKNLANKYIPPNLMKKGGKKGEPDLSMQPRPREKGVVYEFGRLNSYPAFWIKKVRVSSQAGKTEYSGNIKGEISDITTNQALTGKPTVAAFQGDFPAAQLGGLDTKLVVDNRGEASKINFDFALASFPMAGRELVNSSDVSIGFSEAAGSMKITSELLALRDFKLSMNNSFTKVAYNIKAANETADQLLKAIFAGIPTVTLDVDGWGQLPALSLSINSNLGTEVQKGIEKQIQAKIAEARAKLEAVVNEQVGKQRAQIEAQYNQIKNQVEKEIKKLQDQAEAQKKSAENKADQAKKEQENSGKKKVEDEAKKGIDDLKKKMGW
jgi:uncharacterized protein (TIGR03545 family)